MAQNETGVESKKIRARHDTEYSQMGHPTERGAVRVAELE